MKQLYFYIPIGLEDIVLEALFKVGAGKIGSYDCCAWKCKGQGQFRPLVNSNPYLGQVNQLEYVEEYKIELVLEDHLVEKVIEVLKSTHPYETPAFGIINLEEH